MNDNYINQPPFQPSFPFGRQFQPGFPPGRAIGPMQPGRGPGMGQPGFPPGMGQPGFPPGTGTGQQPPSSPPPAITPRRPDGDSRQPGLFFVDPGAIRPCLFQFVYLWLTDGRQFWAWLVFVGPNSVAGWRWTGFNWVFFGTDLRNIDSFVCF